MARANKVTRSIETPDGGRCVDLYRRPDASFGFEEYRRDPEDAGGWFPIGHHSEAVFPTEAAALAEARRRIAWLALVLDQAGRGPIRPDTGFQSASAIAVSRCPNLDRGLIH